MRAKYYLWLAFGWFTIATILNGVSVLVHGPGGIGPSLNAQLAAVMAGFVTAVLAMQMVLIARFHRPWFQVPDTFAAPLLAGAIACGGFAVAVSRSVPVVAAVFFFCPLLSLWIGASAVAGVRRLSEGQAGEGKGSNQ